MLIIPAIDLKDGKCVRLYQGRMEESTVFSDNPVETAKRWEAEGAEILHLVDLNGAFAGSPQNLEAIKRIIKNLSIPVQLGGGIRNMETIDRLLGEGLSRVILGTSAVKDPELIATACAKYGEQIVLGIDAKDGYVAVEGWAESSTKNYLVLALEMKELGITRVIFTDTSLDGTMQGPNIESTKKLALESGLKVIASGGVSSYEDILNLMKIEDSGIEGAITGKAIYTGKIDLRKAIDLTREGGLK